MKNSSLDYCCSSHDLDGIDLFLSSSFQHVGAVVLVDSDADSFLKSIGNCRCFLEPFHLQKLECLPNLKKTLDDHYYYLYLKLKNTDFVVVVVVVVVVMAVVVVVVVDSQILLPSSCEEDADAAEVGLLLSSLVLLPSSSLQKKKKPTTKIQRGEDVADVDSNSLSMPILPLSEEKECARDVETLLLS